MSPGDIERKIIDIQELLSRGANVQTLDVFGSTPLMHAVAWTTDERILSLLISSISNLLRINDFGSSFLTILIGGMGKGRTQKEVLKTAKFVFCSFFNNPSVWRSIRSSVLETTNERLRFDARRNPRVTRSRTLEVENERNSRRNEREARRNERDARRSERRRRVTRRGHPNLGME